MNNILTIIASPLAAIILSPLFVGIIVKIKAILSGRKGPPLTQQYSNLFKLLKKEVVYSKTTSWIFKIAPVVILSTTILATCFIPLIPEKTSFQFQGDIILMLYLLGLSRFFLILSALDTGSPFEGMGASREAFYSALVEPIIFICLVTLMCLTKNPTILSIFDSQINSGAGMIVLTIIPMFVVLLAENTRIPFDDPTTHLELTMIHEAMILDNSGPSLAFMEYAAYIKLWFFSLIFALTLLPSFDNNILFSLILVVTMCLIAVFIGVIEFVMARVHLLKIPQLLFGAGVIALLGFFINITKILTW
jgi:formate hydrogenlyase subunit 4